MLYNQMQTPCFSHRMRIIVKMRTGIGLLLGLPLLVSSREILKMHRRHRSTVISIGFACTRDYFCFRLLWKFSSLSAKKHDRPNQKSIQDRTCYQISSQSLLQHAHKPICSGISPDRGIHQVCSEVRSLRADWVTRVAVIRNDAGIALIQNSDLLREARVFLWEVSISTLRHVPC